MNLELDVYQNLETGEVVLGNSLNLDDEFKRLTAEDLVSIIDNLENWDDLDQEVYDDFFREYNINLEVFKDEEGFYYIDDVYSYAKGLVYGI